MPSKRHPAVGVTLTLLLSLALASSCRKQESQEPQESEVSAAVAAPAKLSAKARAQLVKIDQADGKADKVVGQCVMCQLKMPGKAQHAVKVDGYELHLCSEHCKATFARDPEAALTALP